MECSTTYPGMMLQGTIWSDLNTRISNYSVQGLKMKPFSATFNYSRICNGEHLS